MNQLEFSNILMNRAPEDSEEFWLFYEAAHNYEIAADERKPRKPNTPFNPVKYGMRASRAFKKAFKLRNKRLGF